MTPFNFMFGKEEWLSKRYAYDGCVTDVGKIGVAVGFGNDCLEQFIGRVYVEGLEIVGGGLLLTWKER